MARLQPVRSFLQRLDRIDVSTWSREQYLVFLLAMVLATSWMVASAATTYANLRRSYFSGIAQQRSRSPVPYGSPVPAVQAVAAAAGGRTARHLVVLRADSVPEGGAGLCRLASEPAAPGVLWVALGAPLDPCVSRALGGRLIRPERNAAESLRTRLAGARWLVVDGASRTRYSHRDVPSAATVQEVVSLLEPDRRLASR